MATFILAIVLTLAPAFCIIPLFKGMSSIMGKVAGGIAKGTGGINKSLAGTKKSLGDGVKTNTKNTLGQTAIGRKIGAAGIARRGKLDANTRAAELAHTKEALKNDKLDSRTRTQLQAKKDKLIDEDAQTKLAVMEGTGIDMGKWATGEGTGINSNDETERATALAWAEKTGDANTLMTAFDSRFNGNMNDSDRSRIRRATTAHSAKLGIGAGAIAGAMLPTDPNTGPEKTFADLQASYAKDKLNATSLAAMDKSAIKKMVEQNPDEVRAAYRSGASNPNISYTPEQIDAMRGDIKNIEQQGQQGPTPPTPLNDFQKGARQTDSGLWLPRR